MLITGGNSGLGHELVRLFIANGDEVYGTARSGRQESLSELKPAGLLTLDYAEPPSIVSAVDQLSGMVDGLEMVINCAGIDARALGKDDPRGPFNVDAEIYSELVRINVGGPMELTRSALPLLRNGTNPWIINISSQLGSMEVAATIGRDSPYCVSKAALNMLSVKASTALRPEGIGVLMLHPGWVRTGMGGPDATMEVSESASAIVSTLGKLTFDHTGRFVNWDGTEHPW